MSAANRQQELAQSRAFTAWVNSVLKRGGHAPITDLLVDLQDGVVLCHVIGTLTRNKIRGFNTKARSGVSFLIFLCFFPFFFAALAAAGFLRCRCCVFFFLRERDCFCTGPQIGQYLAGPRER